jgi:hypothetical protein
MNGKYKKNNPDTEYRPDYFHNMIKIIIHRFENGLLQIL